MTFHTILYITMQHENLHTLRKCTDMFGSVFLNMGIPLLAYSGRIVEAGKRIFLISQIHIHPILLLILIDMIGYELMKVNIPA